MSHLMPTTDREVTRWSMGMITLVLLVLIMVFVAAGLAGLALYAQSRVVPAQAAATSAVPPSTYRIPRLNISGAQISSEEPLVKLEEEVEPLPATAITEAQTTARRFMGSIVINDGNTLKSLSTERLKERNPYNQLFNSLMGVTQFSKEPGLIAVKARNGKVELQYRTSSVQKRPCDMMLILIKDEEAWKVDSFEAHGLWDHENKK